jgi:hypothetical protein
MSFAGIIDDNAYQFVAVPPMVATNNDSIRTRSPIYHISHLGIALCGFAVRRTKAEEEQSG